MLGAELTKLDSWTLSLLTNREVLQLLTDGHRGVQVARSAESAVWISAGGKENGLYTALFNFRTAPARLEVRTEDILTALTPILPPSPFTVPSPKTVISAKELWTNEVLTLEFGKELKTTVAAHGVKLFALQ